MKKAADRMVIEQLQQQILKLQGTRQPGESQLGLGLGEIESAFPGKVFQRGAVHEMISYSPEEAACTSGFMALVLARLMRPGGACIWIGTQRRLFPPALKTFGIDPDRILFIDTIKVKDTLWVLEEALKCDVLAAVVGELRELGFNESRRLQLAVERSRVTGFVHRHCPRSENPVACVTRWKISPLASSAPEGLPGPGFPRWNIRLLKVRNGRPGEWQVQCSPVEFKYLPDRPAETVTGKRKTG